MRAQVVTIALLAVLAVSDPARAEHHVDAEAAQALFERGRSAARRGDWQIACKAFEESQRLDPGAGTLLNWAMCEANQQKLASAWQHFNEAAQLLQGGDDRVHFVRTQLQRLEPRLPRLTLRLSANMPEAAQVMRDGTELRAASIGVPVPVNPGRIELQVTCDGHQPRRAVIELHEGERLELTLEPGAELHPSAVPSGSRAAPKPGSNRSLQRDLGLSLVAAGSLAAGLGLASGVVVAARQHTATQHCPNHECDASGFRAVESGEHWLTVNTVAWSLGAVALVSGAVLLYVAPDATREASLQLAPGGASFVYAGSY